MPGEWEKKNAKSKKEQVTYRKENENVLIKKYLSVWNSIRMDLEEIGINVGNWVYSAQDRNYWRALVNAALNLRVP